MRTTLRRVITSRVNLVEVASPSDFMRSHSAPDAPIIRDSCLTPSCLSHRKSLRSQKTMLPGVRARSLVSRIRNSSNDDPPSFEPSAHVLTSYELRPVAEASTLPALTVVPLELTDDSGKRCVQPLWSAIRLLRESDRVQKASEFGPFEMNGGVGIELFAQAGFRDEGEVLRYGAPQTSRRDLTTRALGRGSRREVVEGEPFDLSPSTSPSSSTAYGEILREALYAHALNVMGKLFHVSRVGRSGVLLTAKLESGSWAATQVSDAVAVLDQYTLDVEMSTDGTAQILCTLGHELRSPLSVRQILDDPTLMDLPEGAEVVALGGPHLQGKLSYANIGGKNIGEARDELKGESLLNYHRDRYPARVKLLENARDSDPAVQLVQPGRPPSAYPAELLSPVIQMNTVDANTRDAISHVCTGTPTDLQRRVTKVRSMLGQPFIPKLHLEEKMRRLNTTKGLTLSEATRQGDLQTGPAIMPSYESLHSVDLPQLNILFGNSKNNQGMEEKYVASLVASVESALHSWNASVDVIDVIRGDIRSAAVVWYDDSSLKSMTSDFARRFRTSASVTYLLPLSMDTKFIKAGAHQACSRISKNSILRWAGDASDARLLCFSLLSRRGGQSTVYRDSIAPQGAHFIGAGTTPGLPVVDEFGRVIMRQSGAPSGTTITNAVRTAIDLDLEAIIIHHAGASDSEDIYAAKKLAQDGGVALLSLVDIFENDFGRVLGWSKEARAVTQPERGFWSLIGETGDDAVVVTTNIDTKLIRGVARPLRLRKRLGDTDVSVAVDQILKLSTIDTNYTKSTSSFRLPLTLRPTQNDGLEVLLIG